MSLPTHPPPSTLFPPCTPSISLSQLSTIPSLPPTARPPTANALTAPCCSNTGYNKFALVVTSRMWPWGRECSAAPNPAAYMLTTDVAFAEL